MAETVIGVLKAEAIRQSGPWRDVKDVEFAMLDESTDSTAGANLNRLARCHPLKLSACIISTKSSQLSRHA